jgi:D-amino-acid oxidase
VHVVVLGSGVIGLTSALRLLEASHHVRVVTADPIESTTSYVAAAVWFPTHVGPPDRVAAWGRDTYEVLAAQAALGVPGVIMRESLMLYRSEVGEPDLATLDWTASVRDLRAARPDELPPGYAYGLRYTVPLIEMPRYLPWLVSEVDRLGGQFERRRIGSLAELAGTDVDVIVNCSGLSARELANDPSVYPVRGQIVRMSNPGLRVSVRDEHHPGGRAYVHPRTDDVILGGTLDANEWDTGVDPATAAAIVRRCLDLVPALAECTVLEHLVGLRPGRPSVRLEPDACNSTNVVHNYGHGGSGVTLAWGCAEEVVALLRTDPTSS